MKKLALAGAMLAVSLSACAQTPSPAADIPPITAAIIGPTSPAVVPTPAFPVVLNGPNSEPLLQIEADGSVRGDRAKLLMLLASQKGGSPVENIIVALLMRALTQDAANLPPITAKP